MFRVAAAYAVAAWVLLQVLDVVAEPLHLPELFVRVTIFLLALGLPTTLVLAWLFNIAPGDSAAASAAAADEPLPSQRRNLAETSILALLAVGMVWLIAQDMMPDDRTALANGALPVVVLMDTYAARGVYDEETVMRSRTNADVLSSELADLPVILQKEAIGAVWNRESQIVKQNPAVIVIHRSAFFHSMNLELGFGYPDEPDTWDPARMGRLYDIADNKLVAFLGYMATALPGTRFIVYSRGTGGGWVDPDYRAKWIRAAENRFAKLSGRIDAMPVPGGVAEGSFKKADALGAVRTRILAALAFEDD